MNELVVDVALDEAETVEEVAAEMVADHGLSGFEVVNLSGPGGGWPEVRFSGTAAAVAEFRRKWEASEV